MTPLLLLPRSCLPLSFLDPGSASTAISQSRLFSAYVRALEHEEAKDQVSAVVVVAELEPDRSLYAVERVRQGLYALCKIGKWVNIGDLRAAALAIRKGATRYKRKPSSFQESKGWWDATAVDPFNDAEGPAVKKLRVHPSGPIQFNMRPSLSGTLPKSHDCDNVAVPVESGAAMDPLITPASGPEEVQCTTGPCAQELFDTLRSQYLEALYLSKVCSHSTLFLESALNSTLRPPWPTLLKDPYHERVQISTPDKRLEQLYQNLWTFYAPVYSLLRFLTRSIGKLCHI